LFCPNGHIDEMPSVIGAAS